MPAYDSLPPARIASHLGLRWLKAGTSALVLGAAFGGGILWADSRSDDDAGDDARPALVAADERTQKLEVVQKRLTLHYPDELQGPPRAAEVDPFSMQGDPVKPAPAPASKDEGASTSGTEPPEGNADAGAPPAVPHASKDADTPAPEEEALTDKPRETETAADRTRVAQALANVLGKDTPKWAQEAAESDADSDPEPVAESASYAIQVAATPNEDGAEKMVAELAGAGHKAVVQRVDVDGKGAMFRVRVVGFSSRDAADAYRSKLGKGLVLKQ